MPHPSVRTAQPKNEVPNLSAFMRSFSSSVSFCWITQGEVSTSQKNGGCYSNSDPYGNDPLWEREPGNLHWCFSWADMKEHSVSGLYVYILGWISVWLSLPYWNKVKSLAKAHFTWKLKLLQVPRAQKSSSQHKASSWIQIFYSQFLCSHSTFCPMKWTDPQWTLNFHCFHQE